MSAHIFALSAYVPTQKPSRFGSFQQEYATIWQLLFGAVPLQTWFIRLVTNSLNWQSVVVTPESGAWQAAVFIRSEGGEQSAESRRGPHASCAFAAAHAGVRLKVYITSTWCSRAAFSQTSRLCQS